MCTIYWAIYYSYLSWLLTLAFCQFSQPAQHFYKRQCPLEDWLFKHSLISYHCHYHRHSLLLIFYQMGKVKTVLSIPFDIKHSTLFNPTHHQNMKSKLELLFFFALFLFSLYYVVFLSFQWTNEVNKSRKRARGINK